MIPCLVYEPHCEPVEFEDAGVTLEVKNPKAYYPLTAMLVAARSLIEFECGHAMITQGWSVCVDSWPESGRFMLPPPLAPVQGFNGVWLLDGDVWRDAEISDADLHDTGHGLSISFESDALRQACALANTPLQIDLTVGYGDHPEDVPEPLRLAVGKLIAH